MGKFVIRNTNTGIKFDLKAGNGEVIATSEVYTTEAACKKGIASVQKNAPVAGVENQTVEGYAAEKHPKFEDITQRTIQMSNVFLLKFIFNLTISMQNSLQIMPIKVTILQRASMPKAEESSAWDFRFL